MRCSTGQAGHQGIPDCRGFLMSSNQALCPRPPAPERVKSRAGQDSGTPESLQCTVWGTWGRVTPGNGLNLHSRQHPQAHLAMVT